MKKTWIVVITIIITGLIVGGLTYYFINRSAQSDKKSLETQIEELQNQVEQSQINNQESSATEEESINDLEKAKALCEADIQTGESLFTVNYIENDDGKFVDCSIGQTSGPAGHHLFGKLLGNSWTEVWSGNGEVEQSTIDKYNIPHQFIP